LKVLEEPELERRLGAAYREYRERVPMLVPRKARAFTLPSGRQQSQ